MPLIGRYYKRFADHAVAIARQISFLVIWSASTPVTWYDPKPSPPNRAPASATQSLTTWLTEQMTTNVPSLAAGTTRRRQDSPRFRPDCPFPPLGRIALVVAGARWRASSRSGAGGALRPSPGRGTRG